MTIHLTLLMKVPKKVIDKLEKEAKNLFKWFSDNQTKVNPEVLQVKVN